MQSDGEKSGAEKRDYHPTEDEKCVIEKLRDRMLGLPNVPRINVSNDEKGSQYSLNHPDYVVGRIMLGEAFGTAYLEFTIGLLGQLAGLSKKGGKLDETSVNFVLSAVAGVKPVDQTEAMLAAQMAAVHLSMMTMGGRLAAAETLEELEVYERALNRLARTFALQVETLKRYRTTGEQKITVQHVSVSEGGQAIVGNVTQAARDSTPMERAPQSPALSPPQQAPMAVIEEPERAPVRLRRSKKNAG